MAKKTNTTETIKRAGVVTQAQLDTEMSKAAKALKGSKKKKVTIPKFLEKRLGKNVPVGINGAVVHVPVGQEVELPERMAQLLEDSIKDLKL